MQFLLWLWAAGMLVSLALSGYASGKESIVAKLQSQYNPTTMNGLALLWTAAAWPAHLLQLYVWWKNADNYGVIGPFGWYKKPQQESSN